ncbi:MAG: nicotinate phosphoribosyltransferase [Defluviitaleaceae bacterium]|nr:nicotinate phosphoribosyltransferase [Defluviitaleaceae bacterium]
MQNNNLTLLTDLYQLTMMQGYFSSGTGNRQAVFDLYYRSNPGGNGFAICAGLEQIMEYIDNLEFSADDLEYLRSLELFSDGFLQYLSDFKFSGDIFAIAEGSVVFPGEPLLRVRAPIIQAQLLETALLNIINHQTLIATKAARVCHAAGNDAVLEFGLRRAQGPGAGIFGARAAVIGGCVATSNVIAGKKFAIPIRGTHAHSWIMSFSDELTAFREYAKAFPNTPILLVDTYDTINSGIPNAIKVFDELKESGVNPAGFGIRLDSGDFAYLSKVAREMLDSAGYPNAIICASNDLDEDVIQSLKVQGTKITLWGVGTALITSKGESALGGVYKLSAMENEKGEIIPKIKISENPEKITNPGIKKIFRIYDTRTKKIKADLITLDEEQIDITKKLTIFDPKAIWKKMTLMPGRYFVKELLMPIYQNGKRVYTSPSVMQIRQHSINDQNTLWEEHRRLHCPHILPVDLSQDLYNLKQKMIWESRH